MIPKPSDCSKCFGSCWGMKGYVPASGSGDNGVLLLGEAAGENEASQGQGFVGKAGFYLFQNLQRVGIDREGFKIDNVIACQPAFNRLAGEKYEAEVIKNCQPHLQATIDGMKEKCREAGKTFVICTLGKIAFKAVMGIDEKHPILQYDYIAYPFWSTIYNCWVIPTYHPSYLMRGNTHLMPVLQFCVKRALEMAADGFRYAEENYLLDPNAAAFKAWCQSYYKALSADPSLILSYDIETPYKSGKDEEEVAKEQDDDYTILRCSFSYKEGEAVSVPWDAEMRPALEELFKKAPLLGSWNGTSYDRPRVEAQMSVCGEEIDFMQCWHVLNTSLPKGLGFVAPFYNQRQAQWKPLSDVRPAYYNAVDASVALTCGLGIIRDLKKNGLWEVFSRHILEVHKVFRYMSEKGVLIDQDLRAEAEAKLSVELKAIENSMEEVVPRDVREIKIYKKTPKVIDPKMFELTKDFPHSYCTQCGYLLKGKNDRFHTKCLTVSVEVKVKYCGKCGLQSPETGKEHKGLCSGGKKDVVTYTEPQLAYPSTILMVPEPVWGEALEFKVSKKSLTSYQKFSKHQAIVDRKEHKTTFDEKALLQLVKKYPKDKLYPLIMDHREVQKLLSAFIGVTQENGKVRGGLPVGRDGRIHCTFTSNPSTLRSACQKPNLQQIPRVKGKDDMASVARNLFVAAPGNVYCATDFSGIEAKLVGYFAGDRDYIRLTGIDVHSFYTAHAVSALDGRIKSYDLPQLSWPDDRLTDYLLNIKKEFKADRNNLYKHLVHACVTGDHEVMTPSGWKRFDHLQDDDQVAQWDGGKLKFVVPERVVRLEWEGQLECWKSRSLSLKMTPGHKIPIMNSFDKLRAYHVGDIPKSVMGWARIPCTGELIGEESKGLESWLKLTAAIQADGSLYRNHVRFHLVKQRKRDRLRSILETLGIRVTITKCKDHQDGEHFGFNIKNTPVWDYLDKTKVFNLQALMSLSLEERLGFLDELLLWDGSAKGGNGRQRCYLSTNQQNVETVQTISAISGRQSIYATRPGKSGFSSTKPMHYASFNNRKFARPDGAVFSQTFEDFKGTVYCVTVPSGWFMVKHQGLVSITGNCNFGQKERGAQEKILLETGTVYPLPTIKRVMDIYYELFPKIKQWQWNTLLQVEKEGYLRNPFGYVHRFTRPFDYTVDGEEWLRKPGIDANKIWAFLPQSTAAGIIKEAMLRLFMERFEEAGQYLRLLIHDELFMECPESLVDNVRTIMQDEMKKPILEMPLPESFGMGEYLTIGVESKTGNRWGDMH